MNIRLQVLSCFLLVRANSAPSSDEDQHRSIGEYGKKGIKLLYVNDQSEFNEITQIEVDTGLILSDDAEYRGVSNERLISTDTQKNIIYILAKKHGVAEPEIFAQICANFFLDEYPNVLRARVNIMVTPWARVNDGHGLAHKHGFIALGLERTAKVIMHREKPVQIFGGVQNFRILKTAQSSFTGFLKDQFTTLEDAFERISSTVVDAEWKFIDGLKMDGAKFTEVYINAVHGIMKIFFGPADVGRQSTSIQETQREAQKMVLNENPTTESVFMSWPNRHYFPYDFSRFPDVAGLNETKQGKVFRATDFPYGIIQSTFHREDFE